jgi:hypothetical protein
MEQMPPIVLRQKGAVCRRLARLSWQPEIALALLELAEEFEHAAFDGEASVEPQRDPMRSKAD